MICEHAHPCPPVAPSLDADGALRWAKALHAHGRCHFAGSGKGVGLWHCDSKRGGYGRQRDDREVKRQSGLGDAEPPGVRQRSVVRSSIRADLSAATAGRDGECEAPAALIGGQRMLAAHRQSVELSVDA